MAALVAYSVNTASQVPLPESLNAYDIIGALVPLVNDIPVAHIRLEVGTEVLPVFVSIPVGTVPVKGSMLTLPEDMERLDPVAPVTVEAGPVAPV